MLKPASDGTYQVGSVQSFRDNWDEATAFMCDCFPSCTGCPLNPFESCQPDSCEGEDFDRKYEAVHAWEMSESWLEG